MPTTTWGRGAVTEVGCRAGCSRYSKPQWLTHPGSSVQGRAGPWGRGACCPIPARAAGAPAVTSESRPPEGLSRALSPFEGVSRWPTRWPFVSHWSERGPWSRRSRWKVPGLPCPSWFCVLGRRCRARWQLTRLGPSRGSGDTECSQRLLRRVQRRRAPLEASAERCTREHPPSPVCFLTQGSTLRKRKMYEEFLSKVSILGQWLPPRLPGRPPVRTPRGAAGPCPSRESAQPLRQGHVARQLPSRGGQASGPALRSGPRAPTAELRVHAGHVAPGQQLPSCMGLLETPEASYSGNKCTSRLGEPLGTTTPQWPQPGRPRPDLRGQGPGGV